MTNITKHISSAGFVGSGNVATHLAIAIQEAGIKIDAVFSPNKSNSEAFAKEFNCRSLEYYNDFEYDTNLIIIAVPDAKVEKVCKKLDDNGKLYVHTSGITPIESLNSKSRFGVFYPLQTFSKGKELNFAKIPICIEAKYGEDRQMLLDLARKLSTNVSIVNSEKRKILHLTAVIVSNFSNHLYHLADEILGLNGLDFNYLKPLIHETALKINEVHPLDAQTGPARRNDKATIDKHLQMLKKHPDYQYIYQLFSEQIRKKYHG